MVVAYGGALVGMLLAPRIASLVALGPATLLQAAGADVELWTPDQVALLADVIRILFPMTATLVISAWALGILNSHRRFFLSYVAPVLWNAAIIGAAAGLLWQVGPLELPGGTGEMVGGLDGAVRPLRLLALGALVGGAAQLLVQLPAVLRLLGGVRVSLGRGVAGVSEAIRTFLPVVLARGVVNISGLIDVALAMALRAGAVAHLMRAQVFYMLPISLFGMAVAASELPELSRRGPDAREAIAERVRAALSRVSWFLIPSAIGYVVFGDLLIAALFERGIFQVDERRAAGWVLAAYAFALPASGASRTLSSAFYALRDTKTPARVAAFRVGLSLALGAALMLPLDRISVGDYGLGAAGLALGAAAGSWFEYLLLRRALTGAVGAHGPPIRRTLALWGAGLVSGAAAWAVRGPVERMVEGLPEIGWVGVSGLDHALAALLVGGVFGGVWLVTSRLAPGAAS